MTIPFAHIHNRRKPSVERSTLEGKVDLIAALSIEANSDRTIEAYLGGLKIYNNLFEWRKRDYPEKELDLIIGFFSQ